MSLPLILVSLVFGLSCPVTLAQKADGELEIRWATVEDALAEAEKDGFAGAVLLTRDGEIAVNTHHRTGEKPRGWSWAAAGKSQP